MAKKRSDSVVRALLRTPDPLSDEACKKLLSIPRESRPFDFKESFDPSNNGEWCELIKDLIAMANTDGGYVIIGAKNDGSSSRTDLRAAASIDQATLVDKIGKYTDTQPEDVNLRHFAQGRKERVVFHVAKVGVPIVFCRPGTYAVRHDRQKTAFSAGTIYFRHGSKSEPARQADIHRAFDSMLTARRREMLAGITKVVRAPSDHQVLVMPTSMRLTADPNALGVRVTNDPAAPAVRGLVGSGKYESAAEELMGIVRGMKTVPEAYVAKAQLWRLYELRHGLTDDKDAIRCLLVSSMYRYCPPYYWAYHLGAGNTGDVLTSEADKDGYPAIQVVVRLAYSIAGNTGRHVLEHVADQSCYKSARSLAKRLLPSLGMIGRVWDEYGCHTVRMHTPSGSTSHQLDRTRPDDAETLIDEALANATNRPLVKKLDALVYGSRLDRQGTR